MHFSSSYYLQVIYRTGFLPPFFDFHVIYRLPVSISRLFTGSLFWFTCYLQAPFFDLHVIYRLPFSIYMLFTRALLRFTCYLQAPFFDLHVLYGLFFDLHVIYRLPFSIYTLFTGSLFWFTCYLQALFFDLHVIYRLLFSFPCYLRPPFFIYMFTASPFLFTCYLLYYGSLPVLNLHVIYGFPGWITRNLQAIYSICRNSSHVIYMILALCFETFTVFSSSFTCFTWNIYMFFFTWNLQNM